MARVILVIFLAIFATRQAECGVFDKIDGWVDDISYDPRDSNFIQEKVKECGKEYKDATSTVKHNLNELTHLFKKIYNEDRFSIQWNEIPDISQEKAQSCRKLMSNDAEKSARSNISKQKQEYESLDSISSNELDELATDLLMLMEDIMANGGRLASKLEAQKMYSEMCEIFQHYSTVFADQVTSTKSLLENFLYPANDCLMYLQ